METGVLTQLSEHLKFSICGGGLSQTRHSRSKTVVPYPLTVFVSIRPALFAEFRKLCSARPISLAVRILRMIVETNVAASLLRNRSPSAARISNENPNVL